jgi:hypothetical protein
MAPRTTEELARKFGCSVEQYRKVAAENAAQARKFEALARSTGKKVRGYSADQWAATAETSERRAEGAL